MLLRSQILSFFLFPFFLWGQVNDYCENAVVMYCGSFATGTLQNLNIDTRAATCYQSYRIDQGGMWYRIAGTGDVVQLLITSSSFQPAVSIFSGNCDALACISTTPYPTFGQPVNFLTRTGEDYFIYIQSYYGYGSDPLNFDMTLTCHISDINYTCESSSAVQPGEMIQGSLDYTPITEVNCVNYSFQTQARWYSFIGSGNQVQLAVNGTNTNTGNYYLFLQGSCDQLTCSDQSYLAEGHPGPLYPTVKDETYYFVIFNSSSGIANSFSFALNEYPTAQNANCHNPIKLPCNTILNGDTREGSYSEFTELNTLWYLLRGDGKSRAFSFKKTNVQVYIFSGTCDNPALITSRFLYDNQSFNFLPTNGISYRIGITSGYQLDSFSISIDCFTPPVNDHCGGAISIACGQSYVGNNSLAAPDFYNSASCYPDPQARGLWYKFTGDNKVHSYRLGNGQVSGLNFKIFQGSCGVLECLVDQILYRGQSGTFDFYCKSNRNYWLLVSTINDERGLFSFRQECISTAENDHCLKGIRLVPGTLYGADLRLSSPDQHVPCVVEADGLWYKVVGTGNIYQFDNFGVSNFRCTVMSGSCGNLQCVQSGSLEPGGLLRFKSTKNVVYYVLMDQGQGPCSFLFSSTGPPAVNDECDKATPLNCNGSISANFNRATYGVDPYFISERSPTLWYSIKGDGKFHEFKHLSGLFGQSIAVLESSCGALVIDPLVNSVMYDDSPVFFFAAKNRDYKIVIFQTSNYVADVDFIIQHTCHEIAINDQWKNAIELTCGSSISASDQYANHDLIDCILYEEGVWYKLRGNSQSVRIRSDNGFLALFNLNGEELLCFPSYYNNSLNDLVVKLEIDQVYLLSVRSYTGIGDFNLSVQCEEPPINDDFEDPLTINCGSVIKGDFLGVTPDIPLCSAGTLGIWYTLVGMDKIMEFNLDEFRVDYLNYSIYVKNQNDDLQCITSYFVQQSSSFRFYANQGEIYYIVLSIDDYPDESLPFSISIDCQNSTLNDACQDAMDLGCGQMVSLTNNFSTPDFINSECYIAEPGVWYHIEGNGSIIEIEILSGIYVNFTVYEGVCGDLNCTSPVTTGITTQLIS